jgi:quercetin dioxygenase-like cupin family protein
VNRMGGEQEKQRSADIRGNKVVLAELVNYQEGSIVSRTIMEKKAGTVSLFAFDQGQGLSEHTTPYDALVNIIDGEAEVFISGKQHHLKTGEALVLPATQPHALKAQKKFKMMLIMIISREP